MITPAVGAIILGAIILLATYMYAKSNLFAWIIGIIVLGAGLFAPAMVNDLFVEDTDETTSTISTVSFDITPVNGSWPAASGDACTVTIDDNEEGATVQLDVEDGTGYLPWANYTSVNFSIKPIAPAGATNDDLVTIHFSIDEDVKYGGEYMFYETGNDYSADWRIDGESTDDDGVGSHSMLFTDEDWIELRLRLSTGADSFCSEMQTVGESVTIPVTFSCGSWSETFDVTFIVISTN